MTPSAALPTDDLRECPDCGLFHTLPTLGHRVEATCLRCDAILRRRSRGSSDRALALEITAAILWLVAVISPFLNAIIVGQKTETTMISIPGAFLRTDSWELSIAVLLTAIVLPGAKIGIMLTVLGGLRTANPPRFLPRLFAWYKHITPWAMTEVFLLGVFVAFTRLGSIATVEIGYGLYAVGALMIATVTADYILDEDEVWELMQERGLCPPPPEPGRYDPLGCDTCGRVNALPEGAPCSCCGSRLRLRKPHSVMNTWALLTASAVLYIPANLFPVLTVVRLGKANSSTILGGASELLEAGMWPLALLVFVASILVPMLKLLSLVVMLVQIQRGSGWQLHRRTRLFRLVDFIGRWSMIDVFMAGTLVALVHDGAIADITPGLGATCFCGVVMLTMFAVTCFDPRVMWDAADEAAPEPILPRIASADPEPA